MCRSLLGAFVGIAILSCVACAGSHGFVPAKTNATGGFAVAPNTTSVTVTITVATKSAPARERHPRYFSAASQGLLIDAYLHGSTKLVSKAAVDIAPGSAACGGKKTTPRTCSAALTLAPSKGDDFAIYDYNVKPKSGKFAKSAKVLAYGKLTNKKISTSAKKNKFNVFLGGVIAKLGATPAVVSFPGDAQHHSAALMIDPADYGNKPIAAGTKDPYANPITVSLSESGGTGHTLLSLDGAAGTKSVTLHYSTDTVEAEYDGGGSIGYGAIVTLKAAKLQKASGATAAVAIAPLLLGSTSADLSSGALALKGNGDYAKVDIGEINAPSGTAFTATTQHCDAIESTIHLPQTSSSSGSFAVIARGVAATPNPAGCGIVVSDGTSDVPLVVSNTYSSSAGLPVIATTPIPQASAWPVELTVGPDGAIWFAECDGAALGHVAAGPVGSNQIHQVPLPAASGSPQPAGLYAGPDGTMWFTDEANGRVGNMTTAGVVVQQKSVGTGPTPQPAAITTGADGNMWFSYWCNQSIGTVPTSGSTVTSYSTNLTGNYQPNLALGPDGNIWFTEDSANKIGKITTAGTITEFSIPTANSGPWGITAGPDGAMWFTECQGGTGGGAIGRIPVTATSGSDITEFSTGMTGNRPVDITTGPDGALWFVYWTTAAVVGRITTAATPSTTTITEYAIPGASATYNGWGITSGPDGAIWFSDNIDNVIGRIALPGITPSIGHENRVHRIAGMQASAVRPSQRHHRRGLAAR